MPADFEIREAVLIEVGGIDIRGDDSAGCSDLPGKPHSHGSAARADFETTPAGLNEGAPLTRKRIEDFFKEGESFVFSFLASPSSEAIHRFGCIALAVDSITMLRHACDPSLS